MNKRISVVIICRNAESTISKAIETSLALTDDVVLVDSGSTDNTVKLVQQTKAKLVQSAWLGYGATKNLGNDHAANDWILSLDADEYIDEDFIQSLSALDLADDKIIYSVKRLNYLGKHVVKYGEWGHGHILRVFNKRTVQWDLAPVHEELIKDYVSEIVRLDGAIYHYTAANITVYREKMDHYARLMAKKYAARNKQSSAFKRIFSPLFNFLQNYIFRMGFLDGIAGWQVAMAHAEYTRKKYQYLQQENTK